MNDCITNVIEIGHDTKSGNSILHNQGTYVEGFEESVKMHAHSIALSFQKTKLSYKELNEKVNKLSHAIIAESKGKRGSIGIYMSLSIESIVAILATLKTGNCFIPIDFRTPNERISEIVKQSAPNMLITQKSLVSNVTISSKVLVIEDLKYHEFSADDPGIEVLPNDLMYIIFTSGSTGKPKGVKIQHKAVINFTKSFFRKVPFNKYKSIVCSTSISFDIFILESLIPLLFGMHSIIVSPMSIVNDIQGKHPDVFQVTPSLMKIYLNNKEMRAFFKTLSVILIGGEALKEELLNRVKEKTKARIYNLYGPTETTIWSTAKELTFTNDVTLGTPLENTEIFILDEQLNPVNDGCIGEICITSNDLALGYLNQNDLTNEKFFVKNSLRNARIYRTGDLGLINQNGEIVFCGRNDKQQKYSGYRIELEEIEHAIKRLVGVQDCIVDIYYEYDQSYLVSYYVSCEEIEPLYFKKQLRIFLLDYMIPDLYIRIDEIPLTLSGKLDRSKLPSLFLESERHNDNIEKLVIDLFKDTLNISFAEFNKSFEEAGGYSLVAVKISVVLNRLGYTDIVEKLYSAETIRDFIKCSLGIELKTEIREDTKKQEVPTTAIRQCTLNLEAFNDVVYKGCFYSSLFSVLNTFNRKVVALFNDVLVLYKFDVDKKDIVISYHENQNIYAKSMKQGVTVRQLSKTENIIEDIIRIIDNGSPVIVCLDYYFESIRNDTFMTKHGVHCFPIFNYNQDTKEFVILEQKNSNSEKYLQQCIPYEDVREAYNSYLDMYSNVDIINSMYYKTKTNERCDNPTLFFFEFDEVHFVASNSDLMKQLLKRMEQCTNCIKKSFLALNQFINYFEDVLFDDKKFENEVGRLAESLNSVISGKRVERYRIMSLSCNNRLLGLLNQIIGSWEYIRNCLLRYSVSSSYKGFSKLKIKETLRNIPDAEKEYFHILRTLSE